VTNGVTYYYVVTSTAGNAVSTPSGQVSVTPAPALPVALYSFEGNVLDTSGNNHNGTNFGVTFVTGKVGQAASFNGTSAYSTIPKSIGVTGSGFTIAFWIKTTETGGGSQWYQGDGLVDGEVGGVAYDFGTALVGSKFALGIGNSDTTMTSVKSVNDGNWHHVAATWNMTSGAMQIYVDGNLDSTGSGPTGPRTATPYLWVGKTTDAAQYFNGLLDEVHLYTNVLTAAEIGVLAGLPPNAPSGLNAVAGVGQVTLSWNAVPGVTGYNLYRSLVSGGSFSNILTNSTRLDYTDTGLRNGQTYYYVVTALNINGEGVASSQFSATPLAPPALNFTAAGGTLTLSWPGWAAGVGLYAATNLTPPVVWEPVINAVGSNNGVFYLNLPIGPGQQFFRLTSP
jgi:Concanavalin A-like lectin/glucanases superfamily